MTLGQDAARERAFATFYESHHSRVLAYARRRLDEADARDLVAETFLVAWRQQERAAAGGLPWLYHTARLTLMNMQRTQRRVDRLLARLAALPSQDSSPDHAQGHAERELLVTALQSLSLADREVLLLMAWEDLGLREIAAVVGCSPGAAAVRVHRAKARLRVAFGDMPEGRSSRHIVPESINEKARS